MSTWWVMVDEKRVKGGDGSSFPTGQDDGF